MEHFFKQYGAVFDIHIMTGKSKSGQLSAFINFVNAEDANSCFAAMQTGYEIRPGQGFIVVRFADNQRVEQKGFARYAHDGAEDQRSRPHEENDVWANWSLSNAGESSDHQAVNNTWDGWAGWQGQGQAASTHTEKKEEDAWANWGGNAGAASDEHAGSKDWEVGDWSGWQPDGQTGRRGNTRLQ